MIPVSHSQAQARALSLFILLLCFSAVAHSSAAARHHGALAPSGGRGPAAAPQLKTDVLRPEDSQATPEQTAKQKKDLLKSNFDKLRHEADDLADLAKSLQEELDKSNQHVLSLKVVGKAEKIEKLAKKIKEAARGY